MGQIERPCRILETSAPTCERTALQFAECEVNGFCGPKCKPPAPAEFYLKSLTMSGINPCPEAAYVHVNVFTSPGSTPIYGSTDIKGAYSQALFYLSTQDEYCNGFSALTGGFIGCSACETTTAHQQCEHIGFHPDPCISNAYCIPVVCQKSYVEMGVAVEHNCTDPSTICTLRSGSDDYGAWASGYCYSCGILALNDFGWEDCNGSYQGIDDVGFCPCG